MSEAKQKWDEVGNRFTELGRRLKEHYDETDGEEQRAKVNDALRRIGEALDAGFNAVGESFRDPTVRDELKGAAGAIGDALSSTFADVSAGIKKAVGSKEA